MHALVHSAQVKGSLYKENKLNVTLNAIISRRIFSIRCITGTVVGGIRPPHPPIFPPLPPNDNPI